MYIPRNLESDLLSLTPGCLNTEATAAINLCEQSTTYHSCVYWCLRKSTIPDLQQRVKVPSATSLFLAACSSRNQEKVVRKLQATKQRDDDMTRLLMSCLKRPCKRFQCPPNLGQIRAWPQYLLLLVTQLLLVTRFSRAARSGTQNVSLLGAFNCKLVSVTRHFL